VYLRQGRNRQKGRKIRYLSPKTAFHKSKDHLVSVSVITEYEESFGLTFSLDTRKIYSEE
jgi:hypothetical protein